MGDMRKKKRLMRCHEDMTHLLYCYTSIVNEPYCLRTQNTLSPNEDV